MQRLKALVNSSTPNTDLKKWVKGYVPEHYKRISISQDEQLRLALIGQKVIGAYFEDELYFTQSVIAGAVFSGDYDNITICTTSQYGKSFLMARIALYMAYKGNPTFITASTEKLTQIIMKHTLHAVQSADATIKNALGGIRKSQIEKLETSASKKKLGFSTGGYIEPLTLGETYSSQTSNNAIGNGGVYIIDEASLCSEEALLETGRSEIARDDGTSYPYIQISNPHQPGPFYDDLTADPVPPRSLVIWMDARTAIEEGRYSKEKVLNSKFNRNKLVMMKYWLCDLPQEGSGMFDLLQVGTPSDSDYAQYFMGVDSAYKGKDNVHITIIRVDEIGITDIIVSEDVDISTWIDGQTSKDIVDIIERLYQQYHIAFAEVDQGQGIWLIEEMASRGMAVKGLNFASRPTSSRVKRKDYSAVNAVNVRAEMHLDLQNLIQEKFIQGPEEITNRINKILPYINCSIKTTGKYQIMPKAELKAMIGHSPDELDALLLAIHSAIIFGTNYEDYIT